MLLRAQARGPVGSLGRSRGQCHPRRLALPASEYAGRGGGGDPGDAPVGDRGEAAAGVPCAGVGAGAGAIAVCGADNGVRF